MELNHYNHLYEFFAAVNFASLGTDGFFKVIEESMTIDMGSIMNEFRKLKMSVDFWTDNVKGVSITSKNGVSNLRMKSNALDKCNEINFEIEKLRSKIDRDFKRTRVNEGFAYIGMIGGLFGLVCVLFAGFEESKYFLSGFIFGTLTWLSICYWIILIVLLYFDIRSRINNNYIFPFKPYHCLIIIAILLFTTGINCLIEHYYQRSFTPIFFAPNKVIFLSIITPIFHFPIYYIVFQWLFSGFKIDIHKDIHSIKEKIDNLKNHEIKSLSNFISIHELINADNNSKEPS